MTMVAIRSFDDGSVRVAMMPGIAQAYDDSIATNARPSSPVLAITRSIKNAARDMYPTFSRNASRQNSNTICGMNCSTVPTPPMMPWLSRPRTTELPTWSAT